MNRTQDEAQAIDLERSQLFLIRLWSEETHPDSEHNEGAATAESGHVEWCGRVQHVVSGEAQDFRGWSTLIEILAKMS